MATSTSTETKRKPIKRSGYIVTLSRDHHAGLLFCWKIKQGLKMNIAFNRLDNYILFFWDNHLKQHFVEEEILLFNQLDCPLTHKGRCDHKVLTEWFDRAGQNGLASEEEYCTFVEILTNHIRYEEREIFPHLEAELPAETLTGIRDILAHLHQEPLNDSYADEFWVIPPINTSNTKLTHKMMIIKNIIEQVETSNRPVAKIIKHNGNNKTIAIGLKKGMIWPDHKTSLPTILIVTDGRVIYREGDKAVELEKYDNFDVPVDIVHALEAQEDSLCILLQG